MLLWSHRPSLYSTYCRLQCGYMRLWVMNDYEPTRICGPTHHLFLRSPPITHFSSCTSSCIMHILSLLFCSDDLYTPESSEGYNIMQSYCESWLFISFHFISQPRSWFLFGPNQSKASGIGLPSLFSVDTNSVISLSWHTTTCTAAIVFMAITLTPFFHRWSYLSS